MDSQTINTVAAVIRMVDGNHDKGAGALAEALVETLATAGYALVKLPEMMIDEDEFETWPVVQQYDQGSRRFAEGTVRIRKTDGRIDFTSVFTPFERTEHAASLGAALIAAAQHVESGE
jgi:hypothetical protein